MSNYLDQLNDVQRAAVTTTDGPVLVVAGPGSGKTRVLTFRIAHLIEKGVAPWEILALTFTNKAAKAMKDRIESVVGVRAQKVWAGTFHSIFARLLRGDASRIGFESNFTIYDSDDSKSLIKNIIKELNLSKDQYNENALLTRISSAKSNLISPIAYEQSRKGDERTDCGCRRRPRTTRVGRHFPLHFCPITEGGCRAHRLCLKFYDLRQRRLKKFDKKYHKRIEFVERPIQ